MNRKKYIFLPLILILLLISGCFFSDLKTNYYPTYLDATESPSRDWLPDFLPTSAKYINEQHNIDTNEIWVKFNCNSIEELSKLRNDSLKLAETDKLSVEYRPPKKVDWWFSSEELKKDSFEIYKSECQTPSTFRNGYAAIDKENFSVFYWCGP